MSSGGSCIKKVQIMSKYQIAELKETIEELEDTIEYLESEVSDLEIELDGIRGLETDTAGAALSRIEDLCFKAKLLDRQLDPGEVLAALKGRLFVP